MLSFFLLVSESLFIDTQVNLFLEQTAIAWEKIKKYFPYPGDLKHTRRKKLSIGAVRREFEAHSLLIIFII
jgi:hypothetical protein